MTINKGKFYKTIGWTTIAIGFYLVGLGGIYDEGSNSYTKSDDVLDADFTIIDD